MAIVAVVITKIHNVTHWCTLFNCLSRKQASQNVHCWDQNVWVSKCLCLCYLCVSKCLFKMKSNKRGKAVADLENFGGGGDFKHITSKIRMSSPKLRVIFRPKSEIQTFFSPKIRWSPKKKKKIFTEIEVSFSAGILRLRLVGGMHSEMEPNCSK